MFIELYTLSMKIVKPREYTASRAWDATLLAQFDGITARMHWTDKPYHWHVNDGIELFVVLDGAVNMHVRENGSERVVRMEPGDCYVSELGDEHSAEPLGAARVLVVERAGSE